MQVFDVLAELMQLSVLFTDLHLETVCLPRHLLFSFTEPMLHVSFMIVDFSTFCTCTLQLDINFGLPRIMLLFLGCQCLAELGANLVLLLCPFHHLFLASLLYLLSHPSFAH